MVLSDGGMEEGDVSPLESPDRAPEAPESASASGDASSDDDPFAEEEDDEEDEDDENDEDYEVEETRRQRRGSRSSARVGQQRKRYREASESDDESDDESDGASGESDSDDGGRRRPTKRAAGVPRRRTMYTEVDTSDDDEEEDEEEDEDEDEEGELEAGDDGEAPLEIERLLARRDFDLAGWRAASGRMQTRHVTDGSMWIQEEDWGEDQPERFLVKWQGHSHLHCSWEHEWDLRSQVGSTKVNRAVAALREAGGSEATSDDPRAFFDATEDLTVRAVLDMSRPELVHKVLAAARSGLLARAGEAEGDVLLTIRWAHDGGATEESVADLDRGGVAYAAALAAYAQR